MTTTATQPLLRILFFFALVMMTTALNAQKTIEIAPRQGEIKIDGKSDDPDWLSNLNEGQFIQYAPNNGEPSQRGTEIALSHDESYLYVIGVMHIENRNEVNRQLTARDDIGNSDFFALQLDPFGQAREGYEFAVTAAGVQSDAKITSSNFYYDFNVVWQSAVEIYDDKWIVEMRIPFNSIRFPKEDLSDFRIDFQRMCNALNEDSYWNPIKPEVDGYMNQFGKLSGLESVSPPMNLSFLPFTSIVYEKSSLGREKTTFNGGLDLKYVYKNAYTLDASLIPDFSQAPSDDQILNLSPFEVEFNENRQFFVEGTELFDKGGYLYSRRIGGRPINIANINVADNEEIVSNPSSSNVLNLIKFTGKSSKGISIGVLNGITAETRAEVKNTETGEIREVSTDPLTNYNSLVIDKAMKNNSSLTLLNNSVVRSGTSYDANLTALLYRWYNKDRTYSAYFKKAISQRYDTESGDMFGHQYYGYISKVSGTWTTGVSFDLLDDKFDNNDLGFLPRNNQLNLRADVRYNKNEAGKVFSRYAIGLDHYERYFANKSEMEFMYFRLLSNGTFKKSNHSFFAELTYLEGGKNFYEPRTVGRHFNRPDYLEMFLEYQTNSNKNLSWSGYALVTDFQNTDKDGVALDVGHGILLRAGHHLSIDLDQYLSQSSKRTGFMTRHGDDVLFGQRGVQELTNRLTVNYAVNAKLNMSLRLRHYWIQVDYNDHFLLNESGDLLASDAAIDVDSFDDNFNTFNVDLIATWQFAPASELSLSYKSGAAYYNNDIRSNYSSNLRSTLDEKSNETLSLKMTYFLDAGKFK